MVSHLLNPLKIKPYGNLNFGLISKLSRRIADSQLRLFCTVQKSSASLPEDEG